ncbi:MAG: 23S rRNA (adenine(2503)-C(2))-methyltransferase RlmN [Acidimicrobiales bacterium]
MPGPYDLTRQDLAAALPGEPAYRVGQVWDGLYRRVLPLAELSDLPRALRDRLDSDPAFRPALAERARAVADQGQTVKWGWALHDGAVIEAVLMHYPDRATVCVSTQAGCAMACGFCATGQAGFTRHLTTGEILEQVAAAIADARPRRVANIVFMGMGEPLANYDAVWAAVERLHGDFGISASNLTVSTVGLVPGIRRLAKEPLPVNLAVSLHAANDELRSVLVPINKRWPLAAVMAACREYRALKGRRLSFEWALIDEVNDRQSDANELAELARPLGAHVNLIPLNSTPGYPARGSPGDRIRAFRDLLVDHGVNATIRRNRGSNIDAACGQLAGASTGRSPGPVTLRTLRRSPVAK